ncbi:MAG: alanine:cation symporter family protein [Lachnospiraceae bacterium]
MEKGLRKKWMGVSFSVLIIVCFGFAFNSVQSNTIAAAFNSSLITTLP